MEIIEIKNNLLREKLLFTTLDCGLKVFLIPKKDMRQKVAIITTKYGSIDLEFKIAETENFSVVPAGIAHFLEHQLFKKQDDNVLMAFAKYGASPNAFTDWCVTSYFFTCTENFKSCLELLFKLVCMPYFSEGFVEKEKLIIEQELRMYDDIPDYKVFKNLLSILYQKHPVKIDIGGTVESIKQVTKDLLTNCYSIFYNPLNMFFIAAGDLDEQDILTYLNKNFPSEKTLIKSPIKKNIPREPIGIVEKSANQKMLVSKPRILVGFKDCYIPKDKSEFIIQELATSIALELIFGKGTKFYNRAYEEGLIDDGFSYSYTSEETFGFSIIGGESPDPDKLSREIKIAISKVQKDGLKKRDIDVAKRERLGRFLRIFDSPESAAFTLSSCYRKDINIFEIPKAIKKINRKVLLKRISHHLNEVNCAISVVKPM